MIIFRCKYYSACGSLDNCNACRGREDMIKEELKKKIDTYNKKQKGKIYEGNIIKIKEVINILNIQNDIT